MAFRASILSILIAGAAGAAAQSDVPRLAPPAAAPAEAIGPTDEHLVKPLPPPAWWIRPGRVALEVVGAALGELSLGLTGAYAGTAICAARTPATAMEFACMGELYIGVMLGLSAGASLGVLASGYIADGDGSILGTLGGGLLGMIAGVAAVYGIGAALGQTPGAVTLASTLSVLVLPVAGSIAAFELTSHISRRAAERSDAGVVAFAAPTADGTGATVAVAGSF